jgi:hypothetical protein
MAASPDLKLVRLLNECANYAMSGFDGKQFLNGSKLLSQQWPTTGRHGNRPTKRQGSLCQK